VIGAGPLGGDGKLNLWLIVASIYNQHTAIRGTQGVNNVKNAAEAHARLADALLTNHAKVIVNATTPRIITCHKGKLM
jgi:hypothetical protein